ncbi:MAG: hypothetical protein HY430_03045 [Candidatus Levybacteria bacterium]|nr:hypothetical protein [Candidatus Levybacteria bacterium]
MDQYDNDFSFARRTRDISWVPFLLIPLFFLLGWVANEVSENQQQQEGIEVGIGGGPDVIMPPGLIDPRGSQTNNGNIQTP